MVSLSVLFVFVAEKQLGGCTGCFILKDGSFIMPILCLTSCLVQSALLSLSRVRNGSVIDYSGTYQMEIGL